MSYSRHYPLPINYLSGFLYYSDSVDSIVIDPGFCRDATDLMNILSNGQLQVTITNSGAGGLDTGSETNDTLYYVYVIWGKDPGTNAVFSVNDTAPTLPSGYTHYRRLPGAVVNNSGGQIEPFGMVGEGQTKFYKFNKQVDAILTAGSALAFTDVSLVPYVPVHARMVSLWCYMESAGADELFETDIRGYNYTGVSDDHTVQDSRTGGAGATSVTFSMHEILVDASQRIQYQVGDAGHDLTLRVLGYWST